MVVKLKFRLLIAVTVLSSVVGYAQNAEVIAVLDSQEILIGDQINLDLTVVLSDESAVNWPAFKDTITAQLEIIDSSLLDTTKRESGETVLHQRLRITSFDTGFIVLPPLDFIFNNDSLQVLSTDPQLIFVSDIPVDTEAEIKEVKEPYDVPFNWKKWLIRAAIALLIIALIIATILYVNKLRRKPQEVEDARTKPTRPAHEIALEKLEALRQKKLWQNDQTKAYYIELSDIVREYIEFQFDVLALEMTTDETVSALKLKGVEDDKIKPLRSMLQMADLAKFAKYKPLSNENELNFETAKTFINQTLVMPLDEPEEPREENAS